MAKDFNYTGTCIPGDHYMVDTSAKLDKIIQLIDKKKYFTINRPRQYGKTTSIFLLTRKLAQLDYLAIKISFEGVGDTFFSTEKDFSQGLISLMADKLELKDEDLAAYLRSEEQNISALKEISKIITRLIQKTGKKVVLTIDEVDKTSNNRIFLNFLAMLRDKYLAAKEGDDITFQSVILAGVHDIKNLKLKLRPDDQAMYNSPWNIAIDFDVDLSFSAPEIETMLQDFTDDTNIPVDITPMAEKLHYYTAGYPFLVSRLCYIIHAKLNPASWTVNHVDEAFKILLKEKNTNFESLVKNIENNKDLYGLVEQIILEGTKIEFSVMNPLVDMGITYGIFRHHEGYVKIHNRVYEQLIYDYMSLKLKINTLLRQRIENYNFSDNFILNDGSLDFRKVLLKFQLFMKEQYSPKDAEFLERHGRLIFLSFIKPIINGKGYDFKEVQISEEKRLDIVVTYGDQKYIIELKIWRGEKAHERGLNQLHDYLDRQNVNQGFLVIYDFSASRQWKEQDVQVQDKQIFAVWV